MFEKLFILVKNNAGKAIIDNPAIPVKYHEAVINEASSSIIEVLKNQMETGRIKDLVSYFQFSGIYNNTLVSSMVNKFANKLNNFYGIDPTLAWATANSLIPPVMQELVKQSKNEQNKDFALTSMLSKLNGNRADLSGLVNQMMVA
jgi:ferric iron reductase protein FhuF